MKRAPAILLIFFLLACCVEQPPEKEKGWNGFIAERGDPPADYVLDKFHDHDIVFIGENHWVREEVLFLQELIPVLYENGIRILGLEMAARDSQEDIDRLLNDPAYNETLAIRIVRHWRYEWPYQEYLDVFRAAWAVNCQLPEDAPRFRIVGLDEDHGYEGKELSYGGLTRDRYMAETIDQEIVSRGEKALVYSHISHAETGYRDADPYLSSEPYLQDLVERGCVVNRNGTYDHLSMGNWIYEEIGERCITVYLHGHWITEYYPDLDRFMLDHREPVGFDVEGSPLAGFSRFDGCIALSSVREENPVSVVGTDRWFDTEDVIKSAQEYFGDSSRQIMEYCQQEANNSVEGWKRALMRNDPQELAKRMVKVEPQTMSEYLSYLQDYGRSPEDYIIEKFRDHDIIFLGEHHWIRHDPLFVQSLIPVLYNNGIRVLGMEFACAVDQNRINRLITAPRYNEALAIDTLRNQYYDLAYEEYADIFRAAWELNSRLPDNAPRFRIVGLNIHTDYVKENYGTPEEREKEEETHALSDRMMAETIEREIIAKGKKALIYSGMHHAFTRYHQLFRMPQGWQPLGLDAELNVNEKDDYWYHIRMGNYIYEEIGDRCMTVCLHYPWETESGILVLPFRGALDQVMLEHKKPVAFDLNGSPFDGMYDPELIYAQGYEDYRNSMMADGYIILEPITEYEGCSVIPAGLWIDTPERLEWIRSCDPDYRDMEHDEIMRLIEGYADFQQRYRHLVEAFETIAKNAT